MNKVLRSFFEQFLVWIISKKWFNFLIDIQTTLIKSIDFSIKTWLKCDECSPTFVTFLSLSRGVVKFVEEKPDCFKAAIYIGLALVWFTVGLSNANFSI